MKKLFLSLALATAFLLVLASCVADSPLDIADDTAQPTHATQTQEFAKTQDIDRNSLARTVDFSTSSNEIRTEYFHADWQSYRSTDALAAATERYIARVKVLDERTQLINSSLSPDLPSYKINTVNRLKVLEVFKGNTQPGEVIEVRQIGGQLDSVNLINSDFVPLTVGDEMVVFLGGVDPEEYKEFPDAKFAVVMNPKQSFYRVPSTGVNIMEQRSETVLESIIPEGMHLSGLVLTVGDMVRIAERSHAE